MVHEGEEDEGEFPHLGEPQGKEEILVEGETGRLPREEEDEGLDHHDGQDDGDDRQWPVHEQAEIDRRPDGDEEEAQEDSFEGFDVALQLVAVLAVGQDDAGQEGPQGGAKPHLLHDVGRSHHDEEGRDREEFPELDAADEAQEGDDDEAAGQDHQVHGNEEGDRLGPPRQSPDQGGGPVRDFPDRLVGQERQEGENRDDRHVLEEKNREGALPRLGSVQSLFPQGLQDDRRGGQGQGQPHGHGRLPGESHDLEEGRQEQGCQADLEGAGPQDQTAHPPEVGGVQLQSREEKHHHHAELGDVHDACSLPADQSQEIGADRDPAQEVTQDRSHAEPLGEGTKRIAAAR